MTAKRETTFYKGVNDHLDDWVYGMKLFNPMMGGPPDFYYEGGKHSLWCEYKFNELPKRESTQVPMLLSDLQNDWLKRAYSNRQLTLVIVGVSLGRDAKGYVFSKPSEWEASLPVSQLRPRLLTRQEIARHIMHVLTTGKP